jgi:hypothetical protein
VGGGLHLEAALAILRFHRWRRNRLACAGRTPVRLRADTEVVALAKAHCATLEQAAVLAAAWPAFGFHQEPAAALYTAETIRRAAAETARWLERLTPRKGNS